jgi:predicted secreted protein
MSLSMDTPDATSKDSSGFSEFIAGVRSGEISFEGLVDHSDAAGSDAISGYLVNRTKIDWSFSTGTSGDEIYSGSGFISSCEISAEMESPVTYSGTITITGTITQGTN